MSTSSNACPAVSESYFDIDTSPIFYNHPDVHTLLDGQQKGTYCIHHDTKSNTVSNPFKIYGIPADDDSRFASLLIPGKRIFELDIFFHSDTKRYAIQNMKEKCGHFSSINDLVKACNDFLRFNVKFSYHIDPEEITGSQIHSDEMPACYMRLIYR